LFLDGHSPARLLRGLHELAIEPITRSANAAIRIVLIRQSVPRAETHQLTDRLFDIPRIDLND